jgi:hypothetical protein
MDTLNDYFDTMKQYYSYYTNPEEEKHVIGLIGNKIVDYINIIIRIFIFITIIFLILKKLPQGSGDSRHSMYFNLILLTTIYQILIYINQNWYGEYQTFLTDSGLGDCDAYSYDEDCPQGLLGIIIKVVDGIGVGITKKLGWTSASMTVILSLIFWKLGWPWQLALINMLPFDIIQGAIYYIFLASKFSPIGFIFGTEDSISDPFLIKHSDDFDNASYAAKVLDGEDIGGVRLKDLNTRFYTMYIILILLIFFTIIILITTNNVIDCSTFDGLLPLSFFKGCMGYRIIIFINVIFFFGFSHDFIQSLLQLDDKEEITCPWFKNNIGQTKLVQLYENESPQCVSSSSYTHPIPMCNASQIIECKVVDDPLKGCLRKRDPTNNNLLKDLFDWQIKHHYEDKTSPVSDTRIIVKKNSEGKYIIDDDLNKVVFKNRECRNSVEEWLLNTDKGPFDSYTPEQQKKDKNIKLSII